MPGVKIRNFLKFLGVYLCSLVVALVAIVSLSSCENFRGSAPQPSTDSTYVAENIEAIVNPSFTSVTEILNFQNLLIEEYSIDETFRTLQEGIVINVSTVCLKRKTPVTKKDIVAEYRANKEIYDNLVQDTTLKQETPQGEENQTTATEGQSATLAPLSTSYHYEVDTVNGQPVKVLVKEEKYESK